MSAMECSRYRCNKVMCDTYIYDIGYVCDECKEEFKEYLIKNNHNTDSMSNSTIKNELSEFMHTVKNTYTKETETTVDAFFASYTSRD